MGLATENRREEMMNKIRKYCFQKPLLIDFFSKNRIKVKLISVHFFFFYL